MSVTISTIVVTFLILFCWTTANIILAISFWFSRCLLPGDRKIVSYLVVYWLFVAAGLVAIAALLRDSGIWKEWLK